MQNYLKAFGDVMKLQNAETAKALLPKDTQFFSCAMHAKVVGEVRKQRTRNISSLEGLDDMSLGYLINTGARIMFIDSGGVVRFDEGYANIHVELSVDGLIINDTEYFGGFIGGPKEQFPYPTFQSTGMKGTVGVWIEQFVNVGTMDHSELERMRFRGKLAIFITVSVLMATVFILVMSR